MSFVVAHAAETCTGLEAGTKAYNQGDYERAIDEWRSCADSGLTDADLFYNLGLLQKWQTGLFHILLQKGATSPCK